MKEENQNLPIEFQLVGIDTEQFAILEDVYDADHEVSINVGLQFSVHPQKRGVSVHFSVRFKHQKEVFLLLKSSCFFKINLDNWNSLISNNKKIITLPKGLAGHLGVITVGTARGVLYEKLKDESPFDKFILPTINVSRIVEEDIKLELS